MLRILIADDHKIVRGGVKLILQTYYPGVYIEEADNGEVLVSKFREKEWDMVITDISMPLMTGLDALRKIKAINPGIPVLMLSMHVEESYYKNALKEGASGYITKTRVQDELAVAIEHILEGKKYFPEHIFLNTGKDSSQD